MKCTHCHNVRDSSRTKCFGCREIAKAHYLANKEHTKEYQRGYHARLREEVIAGYGGRCNCCGEGQLEFLQVDHINNDGADQRRRLTTNFFKWVIDNGFPENLQILCANCNYGKHMNGGVCPHAN